MNKTGNASINYKLTFLAGISMVSKWTKANMAVWPDNGTCTTIIARALLTKRQGALP